jgi:hypothetical protein
MISTGAPYTTLQWPAILPASAPLSQVDGADGGATVLHTCRYDAHTDVLTAHVVRRVIDQKGLPAEAARCAELTVAKLISKAANVDCFPNESAFARYGWPSTGSGMVRLDQ